MKRIPYKILLFLAKLIKLLGYKRLSMRFFKKALEYKGVRFFGSPNYIDFNTHIDASGGIQLGNNIVISTNVIILTHDYSYTTGLISINRKPATDIATIAPVIVMDNCFIGAGVIILPGTTIGSNVIVGAGSLVKGTIESNTIVAGNPARVISATDEWARRRESNIAMFRFLVDRI